MDDMKLLVRILAAIKAEQDTDEFNLNLVSEKVLNASEKQRDRVAIQLQKEGYIEGLFVVDDIDNMGAPVVLWYASHPRLTIKGMEYVHSDSTFLKVATEIKETAVSAAAQIISNTISRMV